LYPSLCKYWEICWDSWVRSLFFPWNRISFFTTNVYHPVSLLQIVFLLDICGLNQLGGPLTNNTLRVTLLYPLAERVLRLFVRRYVL
jgi:hypothetical protein